MITFPEPPERVLNYIFTAAGKSWKWNGEAWLVHSEALTPDNIGAATAAQGAKADSALQPAALTPYRTSSAQDIIDSEKASTSHKSSHATGGADALTPADIGAASASHKHNELHSLNETKHLELKNNGDLTLPNGGSISDSAAAEGSITLTPPNATAGQGLVIRPTVGVSLTNDVGFSAGATITITLTDAGSHISDDWTANGGKDANWPYTITGITSGNLGSPLTGTFAAGDWFIYNGNYINTKIFNIPVGSTGTGFNIRLDDEITQAYQSYPTPPNLQLTVGATSTIPETGHLHLVTADPANVDLYLGDDYQFVKVERNAGGIVIGNNNNTNKWNFKTNGDLEIPAAGDITKNGTPAYATATQGTKADSALQHSDLTPYRTSADQDNLSIALSIAL
jgi:hypothetical protein